MLAADPSSPNRKETKSLPKLPRRLSEFAAPSSLKLKLGLHSSRLPFATRRHGITTTSGPFVKPSLPPTALDWRLATSKAWSLAWSSKPRSFPCGLPTLPLVLPVRKLCAQQAREAELRAELCASQRDLVQLRALQEPPTLPQLASANPVAAVATPSAAGALDPPAAGSGQLAAAVPDPRDEKIAALNFQLKELAGAAFKRSVATAAAFVHNPANDLLSAPPGRETSVSPLPEDPHPAAPPPPPAARLPIKLQWNTGPSPRASVVAGLARQPALPLPPWASID